MDGGNGALRSVRLLHRGLLYYKRPDCNRQGDLFALEGLFDQFQALVLRDPEVSLSCVDPVVEDETYQLFPKRVENHGRRGIAYQAAHLLDRLQCRACGQVQIRVVRHAGAQADATALGLAVIGQWVGVDVGVGDEYLEPVEIADLRCPCLLYTSRCV